MAAASKSAANIAPTRAGEAAAGGAAAFGLAVGGLRPQVELSVAGAAPSRTLTLNVSLPGINNLSDVALEISDTSVHLRGGGFALDEALAFTVASGSASAKFSSKQSLLRIKAPES